jgi:hypothetical protein
MGKILCVEEIQIMREELSGAEILESYWHHELGGIMYCNEKD